MEISPPCAIRANSYRCHIEGEGKVVMAKRRQTGGPNLLKVRSRKVRILRFCSLMVVVLAAACGDPNLGSAAADGSVTVTEGIGVVETTTSTDTSGLIESLVVSITVAEEAVGPDTMNMVTNREVVVDKETLQLVYQPRDGLGGSLVPWAVPGPDNAVFYTMWEDAADIDQLGPGEVGGVPVIRRVGADGTDEVWFRGGYSPAVSRTGEVAYAQDSDGSYLAHVPNPSHLVVADTSDHHTVWSEAEDTKYVPAAWAEATLLAYTLGEGEHTQIWAFDGPADSRLLSDGGLVGAISPDGGTVLIVEPLDSGHELALKRVSDGKELARLDPQSVGIGDVFIGNGGDWFDEQIVIPAGRVDGQHSDVGLMVLSAGGSSLRFERLVSLQPNFEFIPEWGHFLPDETMWTRATIQVGDEYRYVGVQCDYGTETCATTSKPTAVTEAAVFFNPSKGGTP